MATSKRGELQSTALRIPKDLHQALQEQARRQDRSLNGQIVAILRAAVEVQKANVSIDAKGEARAL